MLAAHTQHCSQAPPGCPAFPLTVIFRTGRFWNASEFSRKERSAPAFRPRSAPVLRLKTEPRGNRSRWRWVTRTAFSGPAEAQDRSAKFMPIGRIALSRRGFGRASGSNRPLARFQTPMLAPLAAYRQHLPPVTRQRAGSKPQD